MNNQELVNSRLKTAVESNKFSDEAKEISYMIINDQKYLIGFLQVTEFICALSPDIFEVIQKTAERAKYLKSLLELKDGNNE